MFTVLHLLEMYCEIYISFFTFLNLYVLRLLRIYHSVYMNREDICHIATYINEFKIANTRRKTGRMVEFLEYLTHQIFVVVNVFVLVV